MKAAFTKEEIKTLSEQANQLSAQVDKTIGASKELTYFELAAYHQLIRDLAHVSHLLRLFWNEGQ